MGEKLISALILVHAVFGGIALLCGSGSIATKKGSNAHKKFGKLFVISICISAIVAIYISIQKNHESPFLFSIGILSLYFTISGFRALKFKTKITHKWFDYLVAFLLFGSSIYILLYPILIAGRLPILFALFGSLGIFFAIRDFIALGNEEKLKENWLKIHLGNITGAYISSFTAFVVVNQFLPGIWGWIAPGVIGSFYIVYWTRKVNS